MGPTMGEQKIIRVFNDKLLRNCKRSQGRQRIQWRDETGAFTGKDEAHLTSNKENWRAWMY